MLSRADLERIAGTLTHGNVGHAETLYLQDLVLATVSRETADQLVFKGGTALRKCYQLDRFSDDLDFTARSPVDFEGLLAAAERDLENYGVAVEDRSVDETGSSFTARLGVAGPLYTGDRRSLAFLRLEANTRSSVSEVRIRRYTPPFPDIPSFELAVLDEAEILAEKLRAILTRHQPRDLYDAYHLLEKSVAIDPALVQEKLDYYDLTYDPAAIIERAAALEPAWDSLSTLTYSDPPSHAAAVQVLERALERAGSTS